jgi:hypothetical protein
MGRRTLVGLGVAATMALAGCYASTEPATDVGPESAKLNARGTANHGPASSYFEYWLTGSSQAHDTVPAGSWPAGASGPFSKTVTRLSADADYSFRVCGSDQDAQENSCAQTRAFKTPPAVEDSVKGGYFHACCASLNVNATSGPSGDNAHGSMALGEFPAFSPGREFTGFVTCLIVDGRSAAVGAVGQWREYGTQNLDPYPGSLLVGIVDGHLGVDKLGQRSQGPASPAPDCASETFQGLFGSDENNFVVNDAQP